MDQSAETIAEPVEKPLPAEQASRDDAASAAPAVEPNETAGTTDDAAEADDMLPPDIGRAQLEGRIIEAISTIYDPEIPVNIYELGLIYDLHITGDQCVRVEMTLTSPACPVAGSLPGEVEAKIREVEGVRDVALELVWDPPWTPDRMTEAAKLELGFM